MLVTLFGMVTEVSESQFLNALLPILVTLSPIVTDLSEVQPLKALSGIEDTLSPITTSFNFAFTFERGAAPETIFPFSSLNSITVLPLPIFSFTPPALWYICVRSSPSKNVTPSSGSISPVSLYSVKSFQLA